MTLYTKEGKKLPFPDFLVYSEEHVEPNEVAIYNGAFLRKFAKKNRCWLGSEYVSDTSVKFFVIYGLL